MPEEDRIRILKRLDCLEKISKRMNVDLADILGLYTQSQVC